jgi:hypothetical protein
VTVHRSSQLRGLWPAPAEPGEADAAAGDRAGRRRARGLEASRAGAGAEALRRCIRLGGPSLSVAGGRYTSTLLLLHSERYQRSDEHAYNLHALRWV